MGVVLVHDRPGFIKILICILIMALAIVVILITTGESCYTSSTWMSRIVYTCLEGLLSLSLSVSLSLSLSLSLSALLSLSLSLSHTHTHTTTTTNTAKTPIGRWLIEDLHGVTEAVTMMTQNALVYLSFYPLIDSIVSK